MDSRDLSFEELMLKNGVQKMQDSNKTQLNKNQISQGLQTTVTNNLFERDEENIENSYNLYYDVRNIEAVLGFERFDETKKGFDKNLKNKLLKSQPEESCDFHGKSLEESLKMLNEIFSKPCNFRSIVLIHGKGYGKAKMNKTDNLYYEVRVSSKVKGLIYRYLLDHPRVIAFFSAPINNGGTGATYVYFTKI